MSFLNPISEPVLRFSSADADAPQINYNARTAGDVKTVLKACLVTGYGAKASAGWSIINEVDQVAEFVSPSVAMSDYRLGIDDTSAASTTWFYQYQDARVNPERNRLIKIMPNFDKVNENNGWHLIVTQKGLFFIETVYSTVVNALMSRVTYWGQLKSALLETTGKNIAFLTVGLDPSDTAYNHQVFSDAGGSYRHYEVGNATSLTFMSVILSNYLMRGKNFGVSSIDLAGNLLLKKGWAVVAEQPGLLLNTVANKVDLFGVDKVYIGDRPVLRFCVAPLFSSASDVISYAQKLSITTDYWEY